MNWLDQVLSRAPGHEQQVVERYTNGLLALARRRLPEKIRKRVDPEDIVQSVYRSFFRRLEAGEFGFEESHDVWRLLAVMTYRKSQNAVKYHHREQRNAQRDVSFQSADDSSLSQDPIDPLPTPDDLAVFVECLEILLEKLPEKYQRIVTLRMEGFSIAEIADEVELSQRSVLRVLSHTRELAAEILEQGESI